MPGTNGGTGCPYWLRCAKCRGWEGQFAGRKGDNLEATGRTRPRRDHHRNSRQTNRRVEYRCRDCGHVGWTTHMDAERLLLWLKDKTLP